MLGLIPCYSYELEKGPFLPVGSTGLKVTYEREQ